MRVRAATPDDAAAVAAAVELLLDELGGRRPARARLEAEVGTLIADGGIGELLVAEEDGELVGVLSASWQRAIHVPGRYATIQDLWVHPDWRSRGIGAQLVATLAVAAREQGVARIEVGLPRADFPALEQTEAFYRGAGFEHLGPRMRLLLGDSAVTYRPMGAQSNSAAEDAP